MNLPASHCLIGLLLLANFCLISQAELAREITVTSKRTGSLRSRLDDGPELPHGARAQPVNSRPSSIKMKTPPLREGQSTIKPDWSHRLRQFLKHIKEYWFSAPNLLREAVMMMRYKANCLDRNKNVPVFSEIGYLQQEFGNVYDFYVGLESPAQQQQFWEIFDKSIFEHTKTIVQPWLQIYPRIATLDQNQRRTQQALLQTLAPRVLELSKGMAQSALNTLADIRAQSAEYEAAERKANQLVKDFLGDYSNGATASKVSRQIRLWKLRHPSGKLKLKRPSQAHFADLFGPGEIAKPQSEDELTMKTMCTEWGLELPEMQALIEASKPAKAAIGKLYSAEEIAYQYRYRLWSKYPKTYFKLRQEAERDLDKAHEDLTKAFKDEAQLQEKFDAIVDKKRTAPVGDIWVDQRHSSKAHKLLPFIEPLRCARQPDHYPDITPLLQHFGLHTYQKTLSNMMELSAELSEQFQIQYRHQMIARAFRRKFEIDFNGGAQFCLIQVMKQTMWQLKQNLAQSARITTTDARNQPLDLLSPSSYAAYFKMWSRSPPSLGID